MLRNGWTSLQNKLTLSLAMLLMTIVACSAYFAIQRERARSLLDLEERTTRLAELLSSSLAEPLWNVNVKAIEHQLAALAVEPEIAEVAVTAVGYGRVAMASGAGASSAAHRIRRLQPIKYAAVGGDEQTIGEVQVVLSRAVADATIARFSRDVLIAAGAGVALLCGIVFILLWRMVGSRVKRLEGTVDRIASGDLSARCPVESRDELGRLAARFNTMADRLEEREAKIQGLLHAKTVDIGELRQAQEELRESEERFRTLVQFSFDVYWESDAQHRFTRLEFAEGTAEAPTPGSEIGRARWEVPYLEPNEEGWRKHRETLDAHLPFRDFELARPTPEGSKRYVSVSGLPVFKDGRFVGYRGVGRHITERKRAEAALRESEARFRTFVDHATDAFFIHDEDLKLVDANRHARDDLGYSRDELIGMHPREFDAGLDETSIARLAERVEAGEIVTFESVHRRKDRSLFPVEVRVRRFKQAERWLRLSMVRDITERKGAEKRALAQHNVASILAEALTVEEATPKVLRALCECLEWDLASLWYIDHDAGVLRCSELWCKPSVDAAQFETATRSSTFGLGVGLPGRVWASRASACVSDIAKDPTFLRAGPAACVGLHAAFAFPILLGGEVIGVVDLASREIREPDQDLLDMMTGAGSQIGQFIERKRAEKSLQLAQAELAHLSRLTAMGELTASIAHEVNQPLTGLVSSGNACLRYLTDARDLNAATRAVERMIRDALRASEVITRVRALARKSPPRKDRLVLNDVVLDTVSLLHAELQRHGILLRTELRDELPPIFGDPIQLQQVLLNLIVNAKEAMSGVAVPLRELVISTEQAGPEEALVSVADTGPGFETTKLDEMFEPFHTTKNAGMGMGLTISRSIVEAHGGRLSAKPNRPHGALFQFTIPLWREEEQ